MSRLSIGSKIHDLSVSTIQGGTIAIPNKSSSLIHIQFRRHAGCPICNLHMRSVMKRYDEIRAAGVEEVVFFHSKEEDMKDHLGSLPFACVADPGKDYYKVFGVETSLVGYLNPKNLIAAIKGTKELDPRIYTRRPENGNLGMPADFLINSDGAIVDLKYGTYADDQWTVDEILAKATSLRSHN